jgi:hypothetical protein
VEHLQPRLTVRATLASEALAAHFARGQADATTAFDVWGADPEHVPLTLAGEPPPVFDPRPDLARALLEALRPRLPGWDATADGALVRPGADATLHVQLTKLDGFALRDAVELRARIEVPAFGALPAPDRAPYGRTFLVSASLVEPATGRSCWFSRYADDPATPRVEYFVGDARLESLDELADRLARVLDPPGLDALLTRDGLRGLCERGLQTLPLKKGQAGVAPLGPWPAPALPPAWRWEWKHGLRWRSEPLWNRVALHAAFGTRAEARAALAQTRALSRQPPAILKPLLASLDAP